MTLHDDREPGTFLKTNERSQLEKLISASSLIEVAKSFQISPQTLRAVVGGLTARRGTILQVRAALEKSR